MRAKKRQATRGPGRGRIRRFIVGLVARHWRGILTVGGGAAGVIVLGVLGAWGTSRLNAHVTEVVGARAQPTILFSDLPQDLVPLAQAELLSSALGAVDRPWTDNALPRLIAQAIEQSGWVRQVRSVRRFPQGTFEVHCRYRLPTALIHRDAAYYLVDEMGVRLPGVYNDAAFKLVIRGVREAPPVEGKPWVGEDLQSALGLVRRLSIEPFAGQIAAVQVNNYAGRMNPRRPHLELETDRAAGRILWGSAPGREVGENSVEQKLAILRANYSRTGRVDAHYATIDVSTFPDRFITLSESGLGS